MRLVKKSLAFLRKSLGTCNSASKIAEKSLTVAKYVLISRILVVKFLFFANPIAMNAMKDNLDAVVEIILGSIKSNVEKNPMMVLKPEKAKAALLYFWKDPVKRPKTES